MESFKRYITETPDRVWSLEDKSLLANHSDIDAYTFGVIDNILFFRVNK